MKQKQKEKLVQLLSEMVGQAISLSVTEPNMKTEDFVKDWIANRNEDINAAFGTSRYSEQGLDEAAEKHLNYALFKLSYDDEDGIEQYILDAFEAGVEWQKEQDQPITGNSLEKEWLRYVNKAMKEHGGELPLLGDYGWLQIARHFAEWQKAQMMKEAVEGEVYLYHSYNREATAILVDIPKENLGDKVRIIIVKED